MIATRRSRMDQQQLISALAVWVAAVYAAGSAYLFGWGRRGVVPGILFLEDAERFGSGLPDPEAYAHALDNPQAAA